MNGIERRWRGVGPFEEAWFCEVRLPDGRGLWIRYTLEDGADPHCAIWAVLFEPEGVTAHKDRFPLAALSPTGAFRVGTSRLDSDGAIGRAGELSWTLRFTDRGRTHDPYPPLLRRLGFPRRAYLPSAIDLEVSGELVRGETRTRFEGARGVLGHLWGRTEGLRAWAWAHCNTFADGEDAVFEALAARLQIGPATLPALCTLALFVGDRAYRFSQLRHVAGNQSRWDGRAWTFFARDGRTTLEGQALLPESGRVARLRYPTADGGALYCANSRLGSLRLLLVDPDRGVEQVLEGSSAAVEMGSRTTLPDLHLS